MGFLGGLIRAGVAGAGGALKGSNQANQIRYDREQDRLTRERQVQQDALQKMLLDNQIANTAADNERADWQVKTQDRASRLAEVNAKRAAILAGMQQPQETAPPRIDPLSPEGVDARIKIERATQKPIQAPAPKPLPASVRKSIATNQQTLSSIDEAIAAIEKNPDALHGWDTFMPEVVRKFSETPDKVSVRAPVADVGSLQIHDRTGANMNIKEEPRLAPFVPDIRDRPANALVKLKRLKQRIAEVNEDLQGGSTVPDDAPEVSADSPVTGLTPSGQPAKSAADMWEDVKAAHPDWSDTKVTKYVTDALNRGE